MMNIAYVDDLVITKSSVNKCLKSLMFNTDKNVYREELHSTSRISIMSIPRTVLCEPWEFVTCNQGFCKNTYQYKYESTQCSANKP
jgi:hypothetical protein